MPNRRAAALAAASALFAAGLAACSSPTTSANGGGSAGAACPDASTTGEIVISAGSNLGVFSSVLLAEATGAFDKAGLNVTLEKIPSAEAIPLVAQGRIDAQMTSYSAAHFNAVDSGVDVQWMMPFDTQQEYEPGTPLPGYWAHVDYVGTGPEPDLKGLAGQSVGSPTSGTGIGGLILDNALASVDLDIGDVTLKQLVGADALVALENKAVAATWIASPLEVEAAKNNNLRPIASYAPGVTGTSLIAGPKFLDRPETVVKFLQVVSRTIEENLQGDYRQDPEVRAQLAALLETDESVVEQSPLLYFDPTLSMDGVDEFLTELQDFSLENGGLEYGEPQDVTTLFDPSFVEAANTCSRDWMTGSS
ncbi:ABC transporter substrate-binding protein (plasmid) [Rhodococcus pyridinivorans]|uniref:ABC transporter substrate-binding protein n=1 Tax=Rhodococcus TaxID=1827 RepID=UPI001470D20D|nr:MULTISPECIES: ABC transporter substrate-binding protein [Rhodococcus]MCT7293647.1 ABC transporter substrate-binding protein [Rhodococcus sp. PAE-6]QXU56431.1 ABC transporter substrate-binding protein [Rhodococcus sp. LW-XY12]UVT27488.1 ABC transporter substrate-binding protein [Rhodococcus pyridinivorans]WML66349.1 ABC transporter substrate-binding protein [Rhodococcus sp. AH-ZY2]WML66464.1 ABC transporter substrate-binding protein [Rhodococcus sp. AH-ZY2]